MNIVAPIGKPALENGDPALRARGNRACACEVVEGEKERTQVFEGIVIGMAGPAIVRLYRAKDFLRRRRRAHLPVSLAAHRKSRSHVPRQACAAQNFIICGTIRQSRSTDE